MSPHQASSWRSWCCLTIHLTHEDDHDYDDNDDDDDYNDDDDGDEDDDDGDDDDASPELCLPAHQSVSEKKKWL